jgi:acyl carrier protein
MNFAPVTPPPPLTSESIYAHVRELLVELFEVDPAKIKPEARLYQDLEIDSIDAIDLVLKLKDFTGRKLRPEEFKHVRTVGDVVKAVQALVAA